SRRSVPRRCRRHDRGAPAHGGGRVRDDGNDHVHARDDDPACKSARFRPDAPQCGPRGPPVTSARRKVAKTRGFGQEPGMDTLQAIIIAIVQGATELFPVSSLGHAVVLPALLHWNLDQNAPAFLPFLVMLHLGTATALLAYFWRDWWAVAIGIVGL